MNRLMLILLLFSSSIFSQNKNVEQLEFHPNMTLSIITNHYFGNNYLVKGHQNQSIGFQIKSDFLHYKKFNLGIGIEKSTQKVTDYSIGGNIDKTNSNSIFGFLSYDLKQISKFKISPELSYGGIELRQKAGSKFYGKQSGIRYGFGLNFHYKLEKQLFLYSNISYNIYSLNTNTTPEFTAYFDTANALSLSLGIQFF